MMDTLIDGTSVRLADAADRLMEIGTNRRARRLRWLLPVLGVAILSCLPMLLSRFIESRLLMAYQELGMGIGIAVMSAAVGFYLGFDTGTDTARRESGAAETQTAAALYAETARLQQEVWVLRQRCSTLEAARREHNDVPA